MVDDRLLFASKVYRRTFRVPVRTSRGLWEAREGILLRLEDERGLVAFGEVAPLETFGSETLAGALAWCAGVVGRTERARLASVPRSLPCCAWAVKSMLATLRALEAGTGGRDEPPARPQPNSESPLAADATLPVAGLLPTGNATLPALERLAGGGFSVFKLKIGTADASREIEAVSRVVEVLPAGARLRLDANGGLEPRAAMRWLDEAQAWPVEFIEQPLAADARREMIALAHDHSVPLALDESVRGADDIKRWRDDGWPGLFVLKPAIAGDPAEWMPEVKLAPDKFVFSSALETAIGAATGLAQAFAGGGKRALGYGVAGFFEDDGLGGGWHHSQVELRQLRELDLEAVWKRI